MGAAAVTRKDTVHLYQQSARTTYLLEGYVRTAKSVWSRPCLMLSPQQGRHGAVSRLVEEAELVPLALEATSELAGKIIGVYEPSHN